MVESSADPGLPERRQERPHPVKRPKGKGHSGAEKPADTALARLRPPVERAFAALKRWRVRDTVRISPNRVTALRHAVFAIHRKRSSLAARWTRTVH
ncbi:transposase family protein [Streptomyces sp. JJ36]|uniref:transposase family protein n=1 Tax=Streptomyces sp. JJ36 TaxID=2736645 RepID=UPI0034D77981|nr:hypothetical protein [Streptomyces sp. JJ36]